MDNEEKIQEDEVVEEQEETEEENILGDHEEFTYTVDNNNINNDYNKNDEKKSYIYIFVGLIILVLIIISLIVLVNKKDKKIAGYSSVETKLVEGAKKYFNKYQEQLPTTEEIYTSVTAETLIENSYLKPFSEMVKEGVSCTGYVNVFKSRDEYAYFPYLNCGTEYKSTKLNEQIIEDNSVTSGDGLYSVGNEHIFRGEYPNNYVKFNDKTWRIIKINEDGSIKLIYTDKKAERTVWDNRFNSERSGYVGKNDFRLSRMLDTLNEMYEKNAYIKSENKKIVVKQNWCIGKTDEKDIMISDLNLCSDTYNDLYIGLININEVLYPSLDETCNSMYDVSCTNYNYFFTIDTGWTLNASNEKTYTVFYSNSGSISTRNASTTSSIRPVININSNILYKSGNGTSETPYIIGN